MHGVLIRRSFWCFIIYVGLVIIPYLLHALEIMSIGILLNPFTVFTVVFSVMLLALIQLIPKNHYIMLLFVLILIIIAYVYVWGLYIQPMIKIPIIPS